MIKKFAYSNKVYPKRLYFMNDEQTAVLLFFVYQ